MQPKIKKLSKDISLLIAAGEVIDKPVSIIKELVDETVLVKESSIEKAISMFLLNDKTLVEGAGALGLAAILENNDRKKTIKKKNKSRSEKKK